MSSTKIGSDFSIHNRVNIIRGGGEYFRLITEMADNATYSLHLQTYIFDEDETGNKVADALIRAARRGVLVYVMLDGYASKGISKEFIVKLLEAGVCFRFFMPLFKSQSHYLGRRMHHKVVVVDGKVAIVAGINISNRYNDMPGVPGWLDWAACVEGEAARQLDALCVGTWNRAVFKRKCKAINLPPHDFTGMGPCSVRIRRNDWVYQKTEISKTYREVFNKSKSSVVLMTSYFWPPQKLLRCMAAATARKVNVKLILTGEADVPFAKYAERYLYKWLFRHNIEVYEYQSNILHGKIAVADGEFVTIGSYNVNNISAFASVELNLDIRDDKIAAGLQDKLLNIIETDCVKISRENFWVSENVIRKFLYYLSYRIIHFLFFLFTFYFNQHQSED